MNLIPPTLVVGTLAALPPESRTGGYLNQVPACYGNTVVSNIMMLSLRLGFYNRYIIQEKKKIFKLRGNIQQQMFHVHTEAI